MRRLSLISALLCLLAVPAQAIIYTEAFDGDLSDDPSNPTALTLELGINTISGSTVTDGGGTDYDIFTFTVPMGLQLNSLVLTDYLANQNRSFVGMQAGGPWTAGLGNMIDPDLLLGWVHFEFANVGQQLLPIMAANGPGGQGFIPPLAAGAYTLLIQETGPIRSPYTFDLDLGQANVVPEPTSLGIWALSLLGMGVMLSRRRRRLG